MTQRHAPRQVVRWRGGSRLHGIRCRGLRHRSSVALGRSPLRHRRRPPPNELLPISDVFNAADHGGITLAGLTTDRRSSPASSPASASSTASSTTRRICERPLILIVAPPEVEGHTSSPLDPQPQPPPLALDASASFCNLNPHSSSRGGIRSDDDDAGGRRGRDIDARG